MAIRQVSRITHRKGLSDNLPQLAGAELGWVIDQRKLYIGNGTLAEGAPIIGNTEILTEHTDLLAQLENYVYKGEEGGYTVQTGATVGNPSERTFQDKIDDFASVKDFGAVGDGSVDDTAAINRALFELFCRQTNESIRRSLYFPAGVYKITDTLLIPPFAKLFGEGAESSTIKMDASSSATYVARTTDSLQQIGVNISNQGAIVPKNIEVSSLTFKTDADIDCLLVDRAEQCSFRNVNFIGPLGIDDIDSDVDDIAAIRFDTASASPSKHVVFEFCKIQGFTYGTYTNKRIEGVHWTNCNFNTLYEAGVFGLIPEDGGPLGCRVSHSIFDSIYNSALTFGDVSHNATAFNIFNDVANATQGSGNPVAPVIDFRSGTNASVGDMFERNDTDSETFARIEINNTNTFAQESGSVTKFGTYRRDSGVRIDVTDNTTSETIFTKNVSNVKAFKVNYTYQRDTFFRHGTLTVVASDTDSPSGTASLMFEDDYTENNDAGLTLEVTESSGVITVAYTTTLNGEDGILEYSVTQLL